MSSSVSNPVSRCAAMVVVGAALFVAGCGGDGPNGSSPLTGFDGVLAALDGSETGTVSLNLSNSGSGSNGSFTLNGVQQIFNAIAFNGNTVSASGGGFTFTGTVANGNIDGSYTGPTGSGIFSALQEAAGATPVLYCGDHSGTDGTGGSIGGPFNFVQIGDAIRGVFATVDFPNLQGVVSGTVGDNNAQVSGIPGVVTVLVDPIKQTFAGVYTFDAGESGGLQGALCPTTPPAVVESLLGVFGATGGGTQAGTVSLSLSSDGNHSGSFNLGGLNQVFDAITRTGDRVQASGGGYAFTGTVANNVLDGTYTGPNSLAGIFSALLDPEDGSQVTTYCGDQQGNTSTGGSISGAVNFVTVGNVLRGIFLTLSGTGPTGVVSGTTGDNNAQLAGEPGALTFLPSSQGFSGVFSFNNGTNGGFQGGFCP